jgi:hypothetical protein
VDGNENVDTDAVKQERKELAEELQKGRVDCDAPAAFALEQEKKKREARGTATLEQERKEREALGRENGHAANGGAGTGGSGEAGGHVTFVNEASKGW